MTTLRLLLIIPSGYSKLRDYLGLVLWTSLGLGILAFFYYMNIDLIVNNLNSHDFYRFFTMIMTVLTPIILLGTIPSVHYVASIDDDLLMLARGTNQKALFMLDILLGVSSCAFDTLHQYQTNSDFQNLVYLVSFVMVKVSNCLLMLLATYVITMLMTQLNLEDRRQINPESTILAVYTLELEKFVKIKKGVSPLILIAYATKCSNLILYSVSLIFDPNTSVLLDLAYATCDIVYLNNIASDAYDYVQSLLLKLRYHML